MLQIDAGGPALAAQAAADVGGQVDRGKRVGAGALAAHGEDLAGQLRTKMGLALVEDVVEVAQRVLVHFEEMGDARRAAQALEHLAQQVRIAERGLQLDVVPLTGNLQRGIEVPEHGADVLAELADELLAHRPALDGDFREGFDDEFHGRTGKGDSWKKDGRGL
ncbi:hypothetical protein D3C86_1546400 [compost metagenome]